MTAEESLGGFGLVPPDHALPEIRALLAREADAERHGADREEDLALLCCVQLFGRGRPEDVLRSWDAKSSGMDLGASLDVQLLCGAGLEETKRSLAGEGTAPAAAALKYLVKCETAGDFAGFSPEAWLANDARYFGG